jgi:hypothetical protein
MPKLDGVRVRFNHVVTAWLEEHDTRSATFVMHTEDDKNFFVVKRAEAHASLGVDLEAGIFKVLPDRDSFAFRQVSLFSWEAVLERALYIPPRTTVRIFTEAVTRGPPFDLDSRSHLKLVGTRTEDPW